MRYQTTWQDVNRESGNVFPPKAEQMLEERDLDLMDAFATNIPVQYTIDISGLATNTWSAAAKVPAPMWFPKSYSQDDTVVPNWQVAIFSQFDITFTGGATTVPAVAVALVPHGGSAPTTANTGVQAPLSLLGGTYWRAPAQTAQWVLDQWLPSGDTTCDLYVKVLGTAGRNATVSNLYVTLLPCRWASASF